MAPKMTCAQCNNMNPMGAAACLRCGAALPAMAAPVPYAAPAAPMYVPGGYAYPLKSRTTAMLLEILIGMFGLLGIGWMYAGQAAAGVGWLAGYLAWNFVAIIFDIFTIGIFTCIHVPISILLLVLSAVNLSNHMKRNPAVFAA